MKTHAFYTIKRLMPLLLALISAIAPQEALAFCTGALAHSPDTSPHSISGQSVCKHIDGYLLTFVPEPTSFADVGKKCEELSSKTGKKWFVPNLADMGARDWYNEAVRGVLLSAGATWYWNSAIPQTATFNVDKSIFTNKFVATKTVANTRLNGPRVRPYGLENISEIRNFEASGKAPYFCMTEVPNSIDELARIDDEQLQIQVKGTLHRVGDKYHIRPNPLTTGGNVYFYSQDGLSIHHTSDERQIGFIFAAKEIRFNQEEHSFGFSNNPGIKSQDLAVSFPNRPILLDAYRSSELDAIAAKKSIVLIRGMLKPNLKLLRVESIADIDVQNPYYFSYCHAETAHFRSTLQGCAYFSNPSDSMASILLTQDAFLLNVPGDQSLRLPRTEIDLHDIKLIDFSGPVFGEPSTLVAGFEFPDGFPICAFGAAGSNNKGCNNNFSTGYLASTVLRNGQTVEEFLGGKTTTKVAPARAVSALQAAQKYPTYFPAGTFPSNFTFSFGQRDSEIAELKQYRKEAAYALLAPLNTEESRGLRNFAVQEFNIFDEVFVRRANPITPYFPAKLPTSGKPLEIEIRSKAGVVKVARPHNILFTRGTSASPSSPSFGYGVSVVGQPKALQVTQSFTPLDAIVTLLTSTKFRAEKFEENPLPKPDRNCTIYRQNPSNRFDANADGRVTAGDALAIINEVKLSDNGLVTSQSKQGVCPPIKLYDVNGDGKVTASDALMIINKLNVVDPLK